MGFILLLRKEKLITYWHFFSKKDGLRLQRNRTVFVKRKKNVEEITLHISKSNLFRVFSQGISDSFAEFYF